MGLLSSIGNAVSNVSDAFGAVVDGVVGEGTLLGKVAEQVGLSDLVELATAGPGTLLEAMCDRLNLPEWCGDVAGGVGNLLSGNLPGVVQDAVDLAENIADELGAERLSEYLNNAADIGDLAMDLMAGDWDAAFEPLQQLAGLDWGDAPTDLVQSLLAELGNEQKLQDLAAAAIAHVRI